MHRDIISLTINPRTQVFCSSVVLGKPGKEKTKKHFPITLGADQLLTNHMSQKSKETEGKLERGGQEESPWKCSIWPGELKTMDIWSIQRAMQKEEVTSLSQWKGDKRNLPKMYARYKAYRRKSQSLNSQQMSTFRHNPVWKSMKLAT